MGMNAYENLGTLLGEGATRYEAKAEEFLQQWDKNFGIDPKIGITEREQRKNERSALWQIAERAACPDSDTLRMGMIGLREKGEIRQKSRGGWMLTASGKSRLKASDKRICDVVRGRKS